MSGQIARVIADFGHKFLANFRGVGPFIFPKQRQAKKVMRVRRAGIKGYSPLEFANGVVLHFGVAIRMTEEHRKRACIAHRCHDIRAGAWALPSRIMTTMDCLIFM